VDWVQKTIHYCKVARGKHLEEYRLKNWGVYRTIILKLIFGRLRVIVSVD
jgi:hypothetical protein